MGESGDRPRPPDNGFHVAHAARGKERRRHRERHDAEAHRRLRGRTLCGHRGHGFRAQGHHAAGHGRRREGGLLAAQSPLPRPRHPDTGRPVAAVCGLHPRRPHRGSKGGARPAPQNGHRRQVGDGRGNAPLARQQVGGRTQRPGRIHRRRALVRGKAHARRPGSPAHRPLAAQFPGLRPRRHHTLPRPGDAGPRGMGALPSASC